jgi:hypothetical protein
MFAKEYQMTSDNSGNDKQMKTNDGTTLDIVVDDRDALPHGLVRLRSGVIAVSRLYCPNGHNLVSEDSGARFNGYPGISIMVEGKEEKGIVIISPIHGDDTRFGKADFEPGEVTRLTCPECGVDLPEIQPCGCVPDAQLVGLFLDDTITEGNQVAICDAWGCLRSRITDRFQIISRLD